MNSSSMAQASEDRAKDLEALKVSMISLEALREASRVPIHSETYLRSSRKCSVEVVSKEVHLADRRLK